MQKLTVGLLSAVLVLSLAACGADLDSAGTRITDAPITTTASSEQVTTTEGASAEGTTTTAADDGIELLPPVDTSEPSVTKSTNVSANDSTSATTSNTTTTSKVTTASKTTTTTKKPTTTAKKTTTTTKPSTTKTPTTTTKKPTTTTTGSSGFPDVNVEIHEFETYMLELMNADRVKAGLKPLKMSTYYHDCAEIRAEEASKYFAHERPNGKQWHTVFEDCNKIPFGHNTGENLGIGFAYSRTWIEGIYEALYDSPGHKANMMNPQFTEVAIAIYWTPMEDRPTGYSGTVAQLFFGKIN